MVVPEAAIDAVTALSGPANQAALRWILNKLWDLNLVLISVNLIDEPG